MSYLSEEIQRQMKLQSLTAADVARKSGISQAQISKWTTSLQTSIGEDQLAVLAPALSDQIGDHASLVRAHLMDEKYGPGSELVRVEIDHPAVLSDVPRAKSKGEKAIEFLSQERLANRDLNDLLLDLAKVLGGEL